MLNSGLYGGSGYNICREIRGFSDVLVIMTIPTDDDDLIRALDADDDDCMDQPVGAQELLAGMVAILRRTQRLPHGQELPSFCFWPLVYQLRRQ